jgi:hypothetical protein
MIRRLVQHDNPENRETPLLLLGALRQIDPTIELVYFGDRSWRLGAVNPNDRRTMAGHTILKFEESRDAHVRNRRNLWLGKLLLQGFSQIAEFHDKGDPSGVVLDEDGQETTILQDFTERHNAWITDGGAEVFKRRLDVALGDDKMREQMHTIDQYLAQDGREQYRRIMRGRKMFGPAGMTGGVDNAFRDLLMAR